MMGPTALPMEDRVMDSPLTEPSRVGATELLMRRKLAVKTVRAMEFFKNEMAITKP